MDDEDDDDEDAEDDDDQVFRRFQKKGCLLSGSYSIWIGWLNAAEDRKAGLVLFRCTPFVNFGGNPGVDGRITQDSLDPCLGRGAFGRLLQVILLDRQIIIETAKGDVGLKRRNSKRLAA